MMRMGVVRVVGEGGRSGELLEGLYIYIYIL
jgi:hypothetical protein